ncbi:M23 family metallopeptidase [Mycolicibacterium madagascariense]|uniref:M23 family metallopeptidase n=1 Tax=Mycolicibacterium madagascariense TaxID=212765 RepID=UPI0013D55B09|nr:M23 family metallopeptidase [Mycolicibacterium madagascariense]
MVTARRTSGLAEQGSTRASRATSATPYDATITDIIPFNEFGDLDDLDFSNTCAFDRESLVIRAPELDDLHDTDDLAPLRLAVPSEFRATADDDRPLAHAYRHSHTDVSDGMQNTDVIDISGRGGLHRTLGDGAVKARLVALAMAAGAAAAAAYTMVGNADGAPAHHMIAAGPADAGASDGMQVVSVEPAASESVHSQELANGAAFAADRAQREARLVRPEYVFPAKGVWTSGFGFRWGVLHAGIDIANAIGTPIYAAEDGVVTDAGPAAGFGAWVKVRGADGTVTLYGHVNTWLVSVGERVMAGDQIATIGNRGDSTGPHLHFGVLKNGTTYIDPVPWLAAKGLSPGTYVG